MAWIKLGQIFQPSDTPDWMASHAAVPIAELIAEDRLRIYFTARDPNNRSNVGFFEINPAEPSKILHLSSKPLLEPGVRGAFDEDGATACWLVPSGGKKYLYYTGWNRAVTVPFRNAIGLAVSEDGGETFHRFSTGPILDRGVFDPFFTTTPCVHNENGSWKMWYSTCQEWTVETNGPKHHYNIVYATSGDGINWKRDGTVCIDFASEDEHVITRPCVIKDESIYRMWYSYRGAHFRIGYAESDDGIRWTRMDAVQGLEPSPGGWDSEMIEYAFVFDHLGRRYMLHNGNDFGHTGLGLAVQKEGQD